MSKRSPQLEQAIVLRDKIAALVSAFEEEHPALRVILYQKFTLEGPQRAQMETLAVEIVAKDGTCKTTAPIGI